LIEERRHLLGLSKSEAARRAGINRGTWHEVEIGTRTNIMPDTLNQIEAALEWAPGTLYTLLNPQSADVVISQPDGTVTIVEGKTTRVEQSPSAAIRHAIIATIAAMSDDDLPRLWESLQQGMVPPLWRGTSSPPDRIQLQLDELREIVLSLQQGQRPQDSADKATPYLKPQAQELIEQLGQPRPPGHDGPRRHRVSA
jgi:transcriptional regulator with XRE-family HTH domain